MHGFLSGFIYMAVSKWQYYHRNEEYISGSQGLEMASEEGGWYIKNKIPFHMAQVILFG